VCTLRDVEGFSYFCSGKSVAPVSEAVKGKPRAVDRVCFFFRLLSCQCKICSVYTRRCGIIVSESVFLLAYFVFCYVLHHYYHVFISNCGSDNMKKMTFYDYYYLTLYKFRCNYYIITMIIISYKFIINIIFVLKVRLLEFIQ